MLLLPQAREPQKGHPVWGREARAVMDAIRRRDTGEGSWQEVWETRRRLDTASHGMPYTLNGVRRAAGEGDW